MLDASCHLGCIRGSRIGSRLAQCGGARPVSPLGGTFIYCEVLLRSSRGSLFSLFFGSVI